MKILNFKNGLMIVLLIIFAMNLFSMQMVTGAWNSSISWTDQADGCVIAPQNDKVTLSNVYLGVGNSSNIPQSIKDAYPLASSDYLEPFKTNIVGSTVNQMKTFEIPATEGYNAGPYEGKSLYFEVTVFEILNYNDSAIVTRNNIVDLTYTLYTGCQAPIKPSGISGLLNNSATVGFIFLTIFVMVIMSFVGYISFSGRNKNLDTEKILKKESERESKNIQSLKQTLVLSTTLDSKKIICTKCGYESGLNEENCMNCGEKINLDSNPKKSTKVRRRR